MANNLTGFIDFSVTSTARGVLDGGASDLIGDIRGGATEISSDIRGGASEISGDIVCTLSPLNDKFSSDELCVDDHNYKIYLCGCILNSSQLLKEHNCVDISFLIPLLYKKYGQDITTVLKGVYTLVIVDKTAKTTFIANDLLSKKPLFYYKSDVFLAFSNSFSELLSLLSKKNVSVKADNLAAAMMLSEGFLWDDVTWASGVKYLRPFEYLFIDKSSNKSATKSDDKGACKGDDTSDNIGAVKSDVKSAVKSDGNGDGNGDVNSDGKSDDTSDNKTVCTLFSVESRLGVGFATSTVSYSEAIETFDSLFKSAISLQFEKTRASGYLPLASLSAGMDSRAVLLSGLKAGYEDITCFTYAQSGSVDDSIAKKIAHDYTLDHIFYELDGARFILDVDSAFALNNGEQTYCGATGAKKMGEMLDSKRYGIIHTGVLGGELMGDVQRSSKLIAPLDEISCTVAATSLDKDEVSCTVAATNLDKDEISCTVAATSLDKDKISARYKAITEKYSCHQQLELQKHLRACQNFAHMTSCEFLSLSPFLDEDVYLFLASLPLEHKQERKMYVDWMNKHLPNEYITTYMYGKPKSNGLLRKGKYALRILKGKLFGKSKYDMNPFDYWAKTLPQIVPELQKQLQEAIEVIDKTDSCSSPIVSLLKEYSLSCQLDGLIKAVTVAKAVCLVEQTK